jgi:hypothetical protein
MFYRRLNAGKMMRIGSPAAVASPSRFLRSAEWQRDGEFDPTTPQDQEIPMADFTSIQQRIDKSVRRLAVALDFQLTNPPIPSGDNHVLYRLAHQLEGITERVESMQATKPAEPPAEPEASNPAGPPESAPRRRARSA